MEVGKTVSLFQQFLRCRYYYHHVGSRVGMMVLVCYVVHIFSIRKRAFERRCRQWLIPSCRNEVEAYRQTSVIPYSYGIFSLLRRDGVSLHSLVASIVFCWYRDCDSAKRSAIVQDFYATPRACRDVD